jgi:hypothetical protein
MSSDLHKLLRLKRYEHPTPDYFERFVDEFQQRQRAELLRRSTRSLVWERITGLLSDFHVPRYAYAGVAAAAVLLSTVILATQQGESPATASFALNSPGPTVGASALADGVARPVATGSRSQFPPHYVLETRPVSYESPYSF